MHESGQVVVASCQLEDDVMYRKFVDSARCDHRKRHFGHGQLFHLVLVESAKMSKMHRGIHKH